MNEKKGKANLNTSKFKTNLNEEKSRKRKNPRTLTGDSPAHTRKRGKPPLDLNNKAPNRSETPRVYVTIIVNGLFATALLDGGSDVSIINKELAKQVNLCVLNNVESITTLAVKCEMVFIESSVSLQINDQSRVTCSQNQLYSGPTPNYTQLLLSIPTHVSFEILIDYSTSIFTYTSDFNKKNCQFVLKDKSQDEFEFKIKLKKTFPSLISQPMYDVGEGFATASLQDFTTTNFVKDFIVFNCKYPFPGERKTIQSMLDLGILKPTKSLETGNHYPIDKPYSNEKLFIVDCRPVYNRTRKL
uniref:Peptidase A2 domain-containing protein n=1 Tax=Strongyloides venezuelensis TaxID=75913 RepID=A0A0K0F042_STRVS